MYKIYGLKGAGSVVVEAILAEAGEAYQVDYVQKGPDGRPPASLLSLNPLGQIPVLVLPDHRVMTESAAIALHLGDTHRKANLAVPVDSPLRPDYLRWMLFLATNVYACAVRQTYPDRYTADENGAAAVRHAASDRVALDWGIYAAALGKGPFILGDQMTTVDIYAAMLATWNDDVGQFFHRHPNLKAMYDEVKSRPAIAAVWANNDMDYWAKTAA